MTNEILQDLETLRGLAVKYNGTGQLGKIFETVYNSLSNKPQTVVMLRVNTEDVKIFDKLIFKHYHKLNKFSPNRDSKFDLSQGFISKKGFMEILPNLSDSLKKKIKNFIAINNIEGA